jgi:hypothetical protein
LRRILRTAPDDATIAEGLEELADAERVEVESIEHGARFTAYNEYVARRRERESEQVQQTAADAKQAAIKAGPISPESAGVIFREAADLERLRFEVREPRLEFQEWIDAGKPAVHQIGRIRNLQTHRPEARAK